MGASLETSRRRANLPTVLVSILCAAILLGAAFIEPSAFTTGETSETAEYFRRQSNAIYTRLKSWNSAATQHPRVDIDALLAENEQDEAAHLALPDNLQNSLPPKCQHVFYEPMACPSGSNTTHLNFTLEYGTEWPYVLGKSVRAASALLTTHNCPSVSSSINNPAQPLSLRARLPLPVLQFCGVSTSQMPRLLRALDAYPWTPTNVSFVNMQCGMDRGQHVSLGLRVARSSEVPLHSSMKAARAYILRHAGLDASQVGLPNNGHFFLPLDTWPVFRVPPECDLIGALQEMNQLVAAHQWLGRRQHQSLIKPSYDPVLAEWVGS